MDFYVYIVAAVFILLAILFTILYFKKSKKYNDLYSRFKDVIDLDTEKQKVQKEILDHSTRLDGLKEDYNSKRSIYENLLKEVSILEEDLEFISFGIYKPHFDFDTSDKYKLEIADIRGRQKEVIKDKNAAICQTEWEVGGSKVEGRKMTNRNIKLILRAFNGESDSAILKAKWNNVIKMEERIKKAFEALNKLAEPNHIEITHQYLSLKLDELHVAHEYQEKLYAEKEEQRQIREQMREEERVQKEIEKAKKDAEQDENRYQKALDQARSELGDAHGEKVEQLNEKMKLLEEKLKEAQENKERALSRAQLTKSGHVYVISNIGSFGENVYKIGMTRRLEPIDRVKELGDASVPFAFDVHAMIYSENAPELENNLHKMFNESRLNLVNGRKEFFEVSLDDISSFVTQQDNQIEFTKLAEAKEYRESVAIRGNEKLQKQRQDELAAKFPETL